MEFTVHLATPPDSVPVPSVVVPSRNVTVPLAAEGEVVAVSVMLAPTAGEVFEAISPVVVAVRLVAVTVTADELLVA
jgi:hypothetical protein